MDRKALMFIIIVLSALVILTLVHFNQQAVAPVPSPTAYPTLSIPVSMPAQIDQYQNATPPENLTPTIFPDTINYKLQSTSKVTASVKAQSSPIPTAVPPMTPWGKAPPMTPALPMGAMTPMLPAGMMTPMLPHF